MDLLPARSCPGPRGNESESRLAVKTEVAIVQRKPVGAASEGLSVLGSAGQSRGCWDQAVFVASLKVSRFSWFAVGRPCVQGLLGLFVKPCLSNNENNNNNKANVSHSVPVHASVVNRFIKK